MTYFNLLLLVLFQLLLFHLCSTAPVLHWPRITVLCGGRHVAYAKVDFFEFGEGDKHVEIDSLHAITDSNGHYHFPKDVNFAEFDFNRIKLTIRDQCEITGKEHRCNIPYYHYDIPLKELFPKHEKHHRQAELDLNDPIWKDYRGTHCL